jgi:hypothetical protein
MGTMSDEDGATTADAPPAKSLGRVVLRRFVAWAPIVVVAAVGAVVAVALFASTASSIGPFDTTMSAGFGDGGGTEVQLAPFGQIDVASHRGPLSLTIRLDELREADARAIAEDPESLVFEPEVLAAEVRSGVDALARRIIVAATLGGAVLSLLARRRWQAAVIGAAVGLAISGGSIATAAQTWDADALAEPRYRGLLSLAPQAVGDARDVVDRFDDYQRQLAGIIENVAVLYQGANEVRSFEPTDDTVRVLHVSDLHLNPQAFDLMDQVVAQFAVDLVIDTGDINDWGTTFEAPFADRIGQLPVPYVFIRGNHDSASTARAVAGQANAIVLDGDGVQVAGLTIWGKGDPRFSPDKDRPGSGDDEQEVAEADAPVVARQVRSFGAEEIDIVLVHDPVTANDLGDVVPLVLAGHRHAVDEITLGDDTLLLVEGSTGGAGLRALQRDEPVPLSCSVLYFDAETRKLQAIDRITVAGVNLAGVSIERRILAPPDRAPETDEPEEQDERATTTTTP